MARCSALLLMGLVLAATLCSANAGLVAAEPGRKLLLGVVDNLLDALLHNSPIDLEITIDSTQVVGTVDPGKATLVVEGEDSVAVALEAGKVAKLAAAKVKAKDGAVRVRFQILGFVVVVDLHLVKLKAILAGGKVKVTVILKLDTSTQVLHLQDANRQCIVDMGPDGGVQVNSGLGIVVVLII